MGRRRAPLGRTQSFTMTRRASHCQSAAQRQRNQFASALSWIPKKSLNTECTEQSGTGSQRKCTSSLCPPCSALHELCVKNAALAPRKLTIETEVSWKEKFTALAADPARPRADGSNPATSACLLHSSRA